MKSKNSFAKFAVCFLLALACVCSFVACSKAEEKGDLFPEYKPAQDAEKDGYKDDFVTLDGKLDEDIWTNSEWHSMQSVRENRNENNNVTVLEDANIDAVAVVKEKGIYLGVKSNDKVIYVGEDWNTNPSPDVKSTAFGKTGVTIYMTDARNRYRSGRFSYEIGFAADGMVTLGYSGDGNGYTRKSSGKIRTATVCNGGVNTIDANGYAIEAFIPWEALESVDALDAPESIVATFASHRYNNATPKEAALVWELLDQRYNQGWMQTAAWVEYGASGVREQPEGKVFGTYGDFGYDAAFDVSGDVDGADRQITFTPDPTARRQSRIYVHDIKGTEIYAEAKFTIGNLLPASVDRYPTLGFSFHGDPATVEGVTKICVLHTGVTLDVEIQDNKFNSTHTAPALNGENFMDVRQLNTSKKFDPLSEDGFKLSVYRKGEMFYIFYNDTLYDIKSFPYIQADTHTFIGLYVLNLPVTITDYVFYEGQDAAANMPQAVQNYIPSDYEIDGVAEAKWNEYAGAVASLKTTDASGKTFTAKAIMGSNGLYFIAEAKHEYYFDDNVPNGKWANQYNDSGVAGVTNIAVAIGNDNLPRLHFTVSKYGVYACDRGTGANVIGTMKTTDSGVEGSKTRYTSVAECFIPAPVLKANGGYADASENSANLQLVFVSYKGEEKDNLETKGNYYNANGTNWKWTWPLAVPKTNALNSFARNVYMNVTESGIEKQPAVTSVVNGSADDTSATVTVDRTGDYKWGETYNFTVAVANTHKLVEVKVNGTTVTENAGGGYSFVYNGATNIEVITAQKGLASIIAPEYVTVTIDGNADLTKVYQDGEEVTFTVTLNDEYYAISAVKVNGAVINATSGNTYTRKYVATEEAFAINVDAALAYGDATITVQPRNTGNNGKTGGIVLTFTCGNTSFTETANENGVITLTKKPLGTYTVRGKLFGGELKFADVTLNAKTNAATITHNGTYLNYVSDNAAIVDYGTSSMEVTNGAIKTAVLGTQNFAGEVWFTMKVTVPERAANDYLGFSFYLYSNNDKKEDHITFMHTGGNGFIKLNDNNATTLVNAEISNLMKTGLYLAVGRNSEGKLCVRYAATAEGLKTAAETVWDCKAGTTAITQVGFGGSGTWENTSAKYVSSGSTLDAAIAEMNGYEAKDKAA